MDEMRWTREVLKWVPQEKRKQGWPRQGWRDNTKDAMEVRTSIKNTVIEGKSGSWKQRNGDNCKIICNFIYYIYIYIYDIMINELEWIWEQGVTA
jgi:hypothetical protein